jgi:hypothetical protein
MINVETVLVLWGCRVPLKISKSLKFERDLPFSASESYWKLAVLPAVSEQKQKRFLLLLTGPTPRVFSMDKVSFVFYI